MSTRKRGLEGESQASRYLRQQGLVIVQHNFRVPCGEIDIICRDSDTWVFVEVKRRQNSDFASILEQITTRQCQRIRRAAQYFLVEQTVNEYLAKMRFDIITINDSQVTVEWYKDAF
ncbi:MULTISPECIES: YraN family protein [Idiomarina]|jgi:putative endonuclease|uniref:UPF0102 protein DCR58_09655 n=2 Tax=Idiomarina baltica TaxID=190892 RepID=A0A348WR67_9GAMM|nr:MULTISPECIES: YraN family protein [Idiomarina]MBL74171.1 YraN family protein [Idiomarinaceae bacterium]MEC8926044.1 YraN family protein [Pseudomonadota bacterium]EAQ31631.1 Predicted endonuclease [Idiomarina baltica OS145]KXS36542.1 MAG: endonuclease [Idiomarina sp. T82-3]HAR57029.1 YraN family protein [Idiomarina baltica]|tara:strand:- start:361 stop:711 length:351 start_codon:yes stop_codon:yes gene_type:complete